METQEILKELATVSHTDNRATWLLMQLVLISGASIGMSNDELENLENSVRSIVDQQAILSEQVDKKLAEIKATDEKVAGYHTSVLEQIGALSTDSAKADAALEKRIAALEKKMAELVPK